MKTNSARRLVLPAAAAVLAWSIALQLLPPAQTPAPAFSPDSAARISWRAGNAVFGALSSELLAVYSGEHPHPAPVREVTCRVLGARQAGGRAPLWDGYRTVLLEDAFTGERFEALVPRPEWLPLRSLSPDRDLVQVRLREYADLHVLASWRLPPSGM